jgi:putative endonuclease
MFVRKLDQGNHGEDLAVEFLKKKGFKILERNFRIRGGEIDIVAQKAGSLVFIEVKTRSSSQFGSPFEAITPWKLRTLVKTAQFYKQKHPKLPELMRIDAIGVMIDNVRGTTEIEHIENIS